MYYVFLHIVFMHIAYDTSVAQSATYVLPQKQEKLIQLTFVKQNGSVLIVIAL